MHTHTHASPYRRLVAMAAVSFACMYVLMYAMVDAWGNVLPNINQAYMAGLMTAPMVLAELALMRGMYPDARRNAVAAGLAVILGVGCFAGIRFQAGVTDREFLRSMIPHHASALLMCGQAKLEDPDLQKLCANILAGQQAEIDLMNAKLGEK